MRARAVVIVLLSSLGFSAGVVAQSIRPLSQVAVYPVRSAAATVLSLNDTVISAQIEAVVTAITVDVNQQVKAGQVLVKLQCDDMQLQHQAASAAKAAALIEQEVAASQLQRADALLAKKVLSQQQWDQRNRDANAAIALLTQADVAQQQAALNQSRCIIRAPFDGVVTQRLAAVGQLARKGTALIRLLDSQRVQVQAQLPVSDAAQIQPQVRFSLDVKPDVTLKYLSLSPVVDTQSRSQELRLSFEPGALPIGAAGLLQWRDPRPFIPAKYIVSRQGQLGVFIMRDGSAKFIALNNAVPGRDAPVALPLSTPIVVENLIGLQDGDVL